jgi:hypothetical protein
LKLLILRKTPTSSDEGGCFSVFCDPVVRCKHSIGLFICTFLLLDQLLLTVAYCPDEFSGKGAIIEVDPTSGAFSIKGKFDLPSDIIGCPLLEDPIVYFDTTSDLYLSFNDEEIVSILE